MDTLKNFLDNLVGLVDSNTAFLYSFITLSTFFFVGLFLSLFLREYGRIKRAWFLFLLGGVCFFERALTEKSSNSQAYFYLTLAIGLFYYTLIFMIRVRGARVTNEQKELFRFLDKQADKLDRPERPFCFNDIKLKGEYLSNAIDESRNDYIERTGRDYGIDFEHVKAVIDKLDYYGLSQNDKKQVQDLNYALCTAEKQGFSPLVKSKINDGLGALLKIMSKYGV